MSTSNPFEPPRTADLDSGGSGPSDLVFSEAALLELSTSAPWMRWCARMTVLSLVATVIEAVLGLATSKGAGPAAGVMIGLVIGGTISLAFISVLRRYAAAAERLREGTRSAAVDVVDLQGTYFKLAGVLCIIALVLLAVVFLIGLAAGLSTAGPL